MRDKIPVIDYYHAKFCDLSGKKENKFSPPSYEECIEDTTLWYNEKKEMIKGLAIEGFISPRFQKFLSYFNIISTLSDSVCITSKYGMYFYLVFKRCLIFQKNLKIWHDKNIKELMKPIKIIYKNTRRLDNDRK